jgi:hypothetical protein
MLRYKLRTLTIVLALGPMVLAQQGPKTNAPKSRKSSYYQELLSQGVHPIEAKVRDDLLYTRRNWNRPEEAFQQLDELEKELNAIQTDAADMQQVIARARNLIHEDRTALEVFSTPLEDWAKHLVENPNDAATLTKYVRKAKDLFGFQGNTRGNAYSAKGLAEVKAKLETLEQLVTNEDMKKRYATAKAEIARIERAIAPSSDGNERK